MLVALETKLILFCAVHSVTTLAVYCVAVGACVGAVLGVWIGAARANARPTRS